MEWQVSKFYEEFGVQLGCSHPYFQVLIRYLESDFQNKRNWKPEHHLQETKPSEVGFS